jgi:proliferating cell nuclear antigen
MSEHTLFVKTVQTSAIKVLFETLKEILVDVSIEFTKEHVKIMSIDSSETAIVHMKLLACEFEYYEINKPSVSVGINSAMFFKLIKSISNSETISFYIKIEDETKLGISIENSEKNSITNYSLSLLDYVQKPFPFEDPEFQSVITMPSSDFQKILRDMNNLSSDYIEIKSVGEQLILHCKGRLVDRKTILGNNKKGFNFTKTSDNEEIIQGYFNIKFLLLFTKATNLSQSVCIYLKNNFPIILEYSVGSLGKIKFLLSPVSVVDEE